MSQSQKKIFDPETNQYNISKKRNQKQHIKTCKVYLGKYESVKLQALGDAIARVVQVAAALQRFGLASIVSYQQSSIQSDQNGAKKLQLVITIKRSQNFDKLAEFK